jgi:methanogenic corrinoid protein MtbC1
MTMTETSAWMDRLEAALISIDELAVNAVIEEAQEALTPMDCAEKVISPVLRRIGVGWQEGRVSLSQVYLGSRMCEKALDRLLPPAHQNRRVRPKMAIAVLEDYHNLGQKIVWSILRAGGYEVLNYERQDVPSLAAMAKRDGVEVLMVSTLMYRSALRVKDLRKQMDEESIGPILMVGGAPFIFDKELWQKVGADEVGEDASSALLIAKKYSEGGK